MDVYIEKQLGKKQRKSEQAQEAAESGGSGGPGDGAQPQLAMKPTKLD
jgi:AFG3 family protein